LALLGRDATLSRIKSAIAWAKAQVEA